ncbi:MinD/ParA family protein [Streptomyces sp. NPDC005925]|uniref:MinD/ParA family ATP-binding protein n=1 Tax=Streptomyces sp. NPDC005925 TaxID=3157172 RepID=UPI0033F6E4C6
MPNGDNWQSDVLRDLRGGAAQRRATGPDGQPGQPQQEPQAQTEAQQQGAPGPDVPPPGPAYGPPQGQQQAQPQPQPYGYPQGQQPPAQGQNPAYGNPAHGRPGTQDQGQDQGRPYGYPDPQPQPQPYPQQAQPQAYGYPQQAQPQPPASGYPQQAQPQYAHVPRARSSRSTPDSSPVLDKQLAAAGLKPRRGESLGARALRAVRRTVSSSAAREVAETTATAEALQQPVTTGRQIAVTSIRGGSGKTTIAALLGATYAHYRQDPVLLVEADPALGSLPIRMGADSLRWTTGDLADVVEPQMTLLDVTGYLVQLPDNAWLLPGSQGQVGAMLDTRSYERVMVSLRRYFGVTVVDCETLPAEVARTALSAAQARILTVPATLEGIASTHAVLQWMRGLPRDITTTTVVVLTETVPHLGLDLRKAAERLKATGASVHVLPYDRHLAAGGAIRTELLARATRLAATRLAAEVFQLSQKRR